MIPGVVNISLKGMSEDVGVAALKVHKKVES